MNKLPKPLADLGHIPRVLHVIATLNQGGIETWLVNILEANDRSCCEMDVCLAKNGYAPVLMTRAVATGAKILHARLSPDMIGFVRSLARIVREGRYDVVVNHVQIHSGLVAAACQKAGVPQVASYHNTAFNPAVRVTRLPVVRQLRAFYGRLSIGYALRIAERVTGCSQGVLATLYPNRPVPAKASVIYYGVTIPPAPDAADRNAVEAELDLPNGAPFLLHVGRFVEQKNHAGLVAIFAKLHRCVPDAHLVLVGAGPEKPTVERLVGDSGLADAVHFAGLRSDVPRLMGLARVFVLPSLFEGFGLVALEASAAGCPVVASNVDGIREAVVDGETGMLVDLTDEEGFVRAIESFLVDEDHYERFAQASRARAERFSHAASVNALIDVISDAVSRRTE